MALMPPNHSCIACLQPLFSIKKATRLKCHHYICPECVPQCQMSVGSTKVSCPWRTCQQGDKVGRKPYQPDLLPAYDNNVSLLNNSSSELFPETSTSSDMLSSPSSPDQIPKVFQIEAPFNNRLTNNKNISSLPSITRNLSALNLNQSPKYCKFCSSNEKNIGVAFCKDCNDYFCVDCTTLHNQKSVFQSHDIKYISEKNEMKLSGSKCSKHAGKTAEFYCDNCTVILCTTCVMEHDNNHTLVSLDEAAQLSNVKLRQVEKRIEQHTADIERRLERIDEKSKVTNEHYNLMLQAISEKMTELTAACDRWQLAAVKFVEEERLKTLAQLASIQHELEQSYHNVLETMNSYKSRPLADIADRIAMIDQLKSIDLTIDNTLQEPEIILQQYVPNNMDEIDFADFCIGRFVVKRII